jgi:hypothetical protein
MRLGVIFISILTLTGCGGGGSDYENWHGKLAFVSSSCDIIISDPPQIDPQHEFHFQVSPERRALTQVIVYDENGERYSGLTDAQGDFEVYPDNAGERSLPSAIQFDFISDSQAQVTESFLYNAPHGCTHYFQGSFSMSSE